MAGARLPGRLRGAHIGLPRLGGLPARVLAGAAVVVALLAAGPSAAFATAPEHLPELPRTVRALAASANGRPLVVELDPDTWPVLTALIVEGERAGVRVCARDPAWRFMVTAEFVCTGQEVAEGRSVRLTQQPLAGAPVLPELEGVRILS